MASRPTATRRTTWPLGFVEGLNNKIRVIQRRGYGFRDEEYLRLKDPHLHAAKTVKTTHSKTRRTVKRYARRRNATPGENAAAPCRARVLVRFLGTCRSSRPGLDGPSQAAIGAEIVATHDHVIPRPASGNGRGQVYLSSLDHENRTGPEASSAS